MVSIGVIMICGKNEGYVHLALQSVLCFADEIVIVGDPDDDTQKLINSVGDKRIKQIYRKWDGNYGSARTLAVNNISTEWIFSIDADECVTDNAFLLKDIAETAGEVNNFHVEYIHFINHMGLIDDTQTVHGGIRRFYKRFDNVHYAPEVHEIATSDKFGDALLIQEVKLYHLGYVPHLIDVQKKYEMNKKRSTIHSKQYLEDWHSQHLYGTYKVRPTPKEVLDEMPFPIKEMFKK